MSDPGAFAFYLLAFILAACVVGWLAELLPHTPNRDDYNGEDDLP